MNKEEIIMFLGEMINLDESVIYILKKSLNDRFTDKELHKKNVKIINRKIDILKDGIKNYKKVINYIEEKNKIINEAKEYLIKWGKQPDADGYYSINEHKEYTELLEILERGKTT